MSSEDRPKVPGLRRRSIPVLHPVKSTPSELTLKSLFTNYILHLEHKLPIKLKVQIACIFVE